MSVILNGLTFETDPIDKVKVDGLVFETNPETLIFNGLIFETNPIEVINRGVTFETKLPSGYGQIIKKIRK